MSVFKQTCGHVIKSNTNELASEYVLKDNVINLDVGVNQYHVVNTKTLALNIH